MLGLGSTPDPERGITGFLITVITGLVIPNYCFCPGLGSGLEIHCFNTNGSISGVTRAALLQQEKTCRATEHPWNNSEQGMVSFFHPALRGLWGSFSLWDAEASWQKGILETLFGCQGTTCSQSTEEEGQVYLHGV